MSRIVPSVGTSGGPEGAQAEGPSPVTGADDSVQSKPIPLSLAGTGLRIDTSVGNHEEVGRHD
jgi:hypothetical protein